MQGSIRSLRKTDYCSTAVTCQWGCVHGRGSVFSFHNARKAAFLQFGGGMQKKKKKGKEITKRAPRASNNDPQSERHLHRWPSVEPPLGWQCLQLEQLFLRSSRHLFEAHWSSIPPVSKACEHGWPSAIFGLHAPVHPAVVPVNVLSQELHCKSVPCRRRTDQTAHVRVDARSN